MRRVRLLFASLGVVAFLAAALMGCGGGAEEGADARHGPRAGGGPGARGGMGPGGQAGRPEQAAAVPVQVSRVAQQSISSYIETNGTLEAENEVDIIARTSGPIVLLKAEETMQVVKGQLLARLDQDQILSDLEIARVELRETELGFERSVALHEQRLVSSEVFEQAKARLDAARARHEGHRIQLAYTDIRAPFAGLIVERYVKLAQHVSAGSPLFRLSDFDPLLCPIQVPERELPRLHAGQSAHLTVQPWPGERFPARVLRISPVVEAASGTIRVTLQVDARGKLRPGMFASVFVEAETHADALVIPKVALVLGSIGDTVYVADGELASRRELRLGFREGDGVEVLEGLEAGELVVTVGQDGLADATPIQVLDAPGDEAAEAREEPRADRQGAGPPMGRMGGGPRGEGRPGAGPPGGRRAFDFANMTPEQLEFMKERMRQRGMTDEQIEARILRMKERTQQGGEKPGGGGPTPR